MDPVGSRHRIRKVRARVHHDAHGTPDGLAAGIPRRLELGQHVLGLVRDHRAEGGAVVDRVPGMVGVEMNLEDLLAANDEQLLRTLGQRGADHLFPGQIGSFHEDLGAIPACPVRERVLGGTDRRPLGVHILRGIVPRVRIRLHTLVTLLDQTNHPLDHLHEPLRPRVHHPRLGQHGEEIGGARQRLPGRLPHRHHGVGEVARPLHAAPVHGPRGRFPHHRQDRALHRVLDRRVQRPCPRSQRRREFAQRHTGTTFQSPGESKQELGQHHAAVAARAQQRRPRHQRRHPVHPAFPRPGQLPRDGLEGEAQVGPGVPVGHRKDVDAVQLGLAPPAAPARREQRPTQPRAVHIRNSGPVGHEA